MKIHSFNVLLPPDRLVKICFTLTHQNMFHFNPIFMKTEKQRISYLAPVCEAVELKLERAVLTISELTDYTDGGEL